jgi:hypothetical protein
VLARSMWPTDSEERTPSAASSRPTLSVRTTSDAVGAYLTDMGSLKCEFVWALYAGDAPLPTVIDKPRGVGACRPLAPPAGLFHPQKLLVHANVPVCEYHTATGHGEYPCSALAASPVTQRTMSTLAVSCIPVYRQIEPLSRPLWRRRER